VVEKYAHKRRQSVNTTRPSGGNGATEKVGRAGRVLRRWGAQAPMADDCGPGRPSLRRFESIAEFRGEGPPSRPGSSRGGQAST